MVELSLKAKAIHGVMWNLIERFGIHGIRFVTGIFLARLLTPSDFGLIGLIVVFFTLAQVLVESGFGQAYIQKKNVNNDDANTIFYVNLFISFITYLVLWKIAPSISKFYDEPELINLVRVMGLVVIINAFNVIQIAKLSRDVNFKLKTKITLNATLISGISGLTAAYYGLGVWSLVIQQITNRMFTTVGLWITSRWKPGLIFSVKSLQSLFSFGSWVLAASILRTVFDNIYILSIGKLFPTEQLGFYTNAKQFQQSSSEQISGAVGSVAFPIFSQLQEDSSRLREAVRKFLTHTLVFTAPLLIILIVIAKPLVIILLTAKWAPMIPYIQLLSIVGILYPIHLVNVQVLQSQGKSNLNFKITVLKNLFRIINVVVMYKYGVVFIIIGEIIISFLSLIINSYYTNQIVGYGLIDQFNDIKIIIMGSVLSGISGYFLSYSISNLYLQFILGLFVTVSGYILLQYFTNKILFIEIIKLKENFIK